MQSEEFKGDADSILLMDSYLDDIEICTHLRQEVTFTIGFSEIAEYRIEGDGNYEFRIRENRREISFETNSCVGATLIKRFPTTGSVRLSPGDYVISRKDNEVLFSIQEVEERMTLINDGDW